MRPRDSPAGPRQPYRSKLYEADISGRHHRAVSCDLFQSSQFVFCNLIDDRGLIHHVDRIRQWLAPSRRTDCRRLYDFLDPRRSGEKSFSVRSTSLIKPFATLTQRTVDEIPHLDDRDSIARAGYTAQRIEFRPDPSRGCDARQQGADQRDVD
jgi:hypothetical protein